jgi:GT2 family glycosyltransferase
VEVFVVVVLYKCAVGESLTCISLMNQMQANARDAVLLYDNSPAPDPHSIPAGWDYRHDPGNGGLAQAYNDAVARAQSAGYGWMLLLDQDSRLPPDFLVGVRNSMRAMDSRNDVVALVPIVESNSRQLSPLIPKPAWEKPYGRRNLVESDWLMAINSGTCVRVAFIEELGGFSKDFWLDYLDHWLFKMIAVHGRSIYVMDAVIQHELSVTDMNRGMSVERYSNILAAELHFANEFLPLSWRLALVPRLLARALKHLIATSDKRLAARMAIAACTQLSTCLFRR